MSLIINDLRISVSLFENLIHRRDAICFIFNLIFVISYNQIRDELNGFFFNHV